ncbi:Keratin; type I cuticular Ha2 [Camelus dromedarius]|uniref:Keratin n=1 Tax=Camelus dromedarius TaxID=9838 RepID=A0A5N4D392_CAMDR|nr:Keratin; type I cuticular Ha2 [Camelus dromedarius]
MSALRLHVRHLPDSQLRLQGLPVQSCRPSSRGPTSGISSSIGTCSWSCKGSFNGNKKGTMQSLNNCLTNYPEKVRQLKRDNTELE